MDPLSIAAGATGLVTACVKISATLYTFIDDSRTVDSSVIGLCDEVLGLSRVLDAISKSWKQTPLLVVAKADPNGDLWVNVKASIDDCEKTVTNLERELYNVQKDSFFGRGFMRKPTKQLKLNLRMKDIQLFRQQVHTHATGMQSALQMINVCLLISGQSSQEQVVQSLQELKSQIGRVESTLQSRNSSSVSLVDKQDNERIFATLQRLVSAAETFHSSASTVVGDSTVWGGSVMGEPLSHQQFRNIESWIPPPISEESTTDYTDHRSEGTRITSPSTEMSSNQADLPANSNEVNEARRSIASDSDSDLETDMREKFEELALIKLEQRDYAKAEMFLRKLVENRDQEGGKEFPLIQLKIASTCCFQGRWEEAESIAIPIAMGRERVDVSAFHILHAFAIRKSQSGQIDEAVRWCKRALWGKKKLLGKNDPSYYESMALLARLYNSRGDAVEAEACRSFIPPTTTIDQDPLSYLFKCMSGDSKDQTDTLLLSPTHQTRSSQTQLTTPPIETPPLLSPRSPPNFPRDQVPGIRNTTPQPINRASPGSQQRFPTPISRQRSAQEAPAQSRVLQPVTRPYTRSSGSAYTESKPNPRLVVSIDLGTTFTGVAYCLVTEAGQENEINTMTRWPGAGSVHKLRIPTVLYYDTYQKVVGWGPDIADALSPSGYPKDGFQKNEWFLIELLQRESDYHSPQINLPPYPPGKDGADLVADYLFHLGTAIRSELRLQFKLVDPLLESQIEWCFTFPPGAGDNFTKAYRSAVAQAGYDQNNGTPCSTFMSGMEACLFSASKTGLLTLQLHDAVLVVKCGGGIVDLMAFEMVDKKNCEYAKVTRNTGDSCGSTALNRNFSNIVKQKIRKMNLPENSRVAGKIYAKNIMDFENRIKADFRDNGQKWAVHVDIEAEFPTADIEKGYMSWTNDEILTCFEPVVNRVCELIRNQIIALQSLNRTPERILMVGGFAASEYLFNRVKLHVPPELKEKVVRPVDVLNSVAIGATMSRLAYQGRTTKRMYLIESLELFNPGVDPEYYRLASLDGQDRCRYTWGTAVPIGTTFMPDESLSIQLEKIVAPGESPIFEDAIYASDVEPPPYIVASNVEVAGKMTTNLTAFDPDVQFAKLEGPYGIYYHVKYEIVFSYAYPNSWVITSVFKGNDVGTCTIDFR